MSCYSEPSFGKTLLTFNMTLVTLLDGVVSKAVEAAVYESTQRRQCCNFISLLVLFKNQCYNRLYHGAMSVLSQVVDYTDF